MRDEFELMAKLQGYNAKAKDFDRHQRSVAGLETGDGSSHYKKDNANAAEAAKRKAKQQTNATDSALFIELLDQRSAWLKKQISAAEDGFARDDGEDWREKLALQILDADVMPQRFDGESMGDYRERVKQALVDELLSEDGTIKAKYKNHPEYGKYGEWAQHKFDQQQAEGLKADLADPDLTDSQRSTQLESYKQSATHERLEQALKQNVNDPSTQATLDTAKENLEDKLADATPSVADNGFLSG